MPTPLSGSAFSARSVVFAVALLTLLWFMPAAFAQTTAASAAASAMPPSPIPTLVSVAVAPSYLVGGLPAIGTVIAGSGAAIGLSSSNPAVQVPSGVSVGANGTASFPITTTAVSSATPVTITASQRYATGANGVYQYYTVTATLTVNPVPVSTSIAVSPASATLTTGGTQTFTAVAKDQYGTALATQPAFTWTSTGVGAVSSAGVYSVGLTSGSASVKATSGMISGIAVVTIVPPTTAASGGFNLASNPINITVVQGNSGTANLSLAPINGFVGQVALSVSGLPPGVSSKFSPASVSVTNTSTQTSVLTLSLQSNIRPGRYSLDIKGSATAVDGTSVTNSNLVILTVAPTPTSVPFTVTANNDFVNLALGASDSSTISLSSASGFNQNVSLAISDDLAYPIVASQSEPNKVAFAFSTQTLTPGNTATLSVTAGSSVPAGVYHLLVTAIASNGQQAVTPFTVVISEDSNSETAIDPPGPTNTNASYSPASSASGMERVEANGSSLIVGTNLSSASNSIPNPPNANPNVVGTDDRLSVYGNPYPFYYPFTAICRITVVQPDGAVFFGTGTLVGRNHVLTAAHLLFDKNHGGYPSVVKVYPAYAGKPNPKFGFAKQRRLYVPLNYRLYGGVGKFIYQPGDDFGLIDLMPISNSLASVNGKSLGDLAGYVPMADDYNGFDDTVTTLAGYPGVFKGHTLASSFMYQDFYGNGSGDKSVYPYPFFTGPTLDDSLFTALDADDGDSGAGFLHQPDSLDASWTVYGVYDDYAGSYGVQGILPTQPQSGEAVGSRITTRRLEILKNVMALDGDDIAY